MAQLNAKVSRPNNKVTKHPNEQNISTTLGFGEVTSLGFVEMQGNTKANGTIGSLIRTSTMPVPTFGKISYKTYARFIPTTDIFRNNENLKSELPITTQFGTFIPKNQPYINVNWLSALLLAKYCRLYIYGNNANLTGNANDETVILSNTVQVGEDFNAYTNLYNYIDLKLNTDESEAYKNPFIEFDIVSNLDNRITPNNCDFTITRSNVDNLSSNLGDWTSNDYNTFLYCFRLTKKGKTLYRILTSLGWKFSLRNDEHCNILPLMAYYKGYFELFQPKNTATNANVYTNTSTFKLSDYICEHDIYQIIDWNEEWDEEESQYIYSAGQTYNLFLGMLEEIASSYYYNKPNLITSHIATPSISQGNNINVNSPIAVNTTKAIMKGNNTNPYIKPYLEQTYITAPSLKLLMRMYVLTNKQTIIGGNIRKLIQSLYGYDPDTLDGIVYDCGRNSYDLDISMIPSQSDTFNASAQTGAQLGELGGLATGKSTKDNNGALKWKCNADKDGYLIFYAVIVPNSQFFQGTDPRLKHGTNGKYSLYIEEFDSVGMEISTKSILQAERCNEIPQMRISNHVYGNDSATENIAFGFIPQKMDYKILSGDIVNGDLRRQPYKNQLRPYFLGKEISEPSVVAESITGGYKITMGSPNNTPIATPELRSIGKYNWLENFNKIFYQYDERLIETDNAMATSFANIYGYDDPFIIHNTNEYDKFDHMKPTTESFETDGEDGNSIDVEHA